MQYIIWLSHKHGDWEAVVHTWILPLARNERRQLKVMAKVFPDFSRFFYFLFLTPLSGKLTENSDIRICIKS